jgi:hypothetical protein
MRCRVFLRPICASVGTFITPPVSSILMIIAAVPEPILTEELNAHFEAAMTLENATVQAAASEAQATRSPGMRGPGLPSGPRAGAPVPIGAMRKPPSLSTLAAPSFAGLRPPSKTLIDALSALIARLPRENRDLLRTVVDLIRATAQRSKVTKMPLSNLLLVFCPSMHMSPPLLRVLAEAEGVWQRPAPPQARAVSPAGKDEPKGDEKRSEHKHESFVLDIKSTERQSVLDIRPLTAVPPSTSDSPAATDSITSEIELTHELSSSTDDSASSLSASDLSASSSQSTPLDTSPFPAAFSSAESLGPSTPAEDQSFLQPIIPAADALKQLAFVAAAAEPVIESSTDGPVMTPRPSVAVNVAPIEFPIAAVTATSPPSTPLHKRRSSPFLSLPGLRSGDSSPARSPTNSSPSASPLAPSSPSAKAFRMKRPSLTLLSFGKRTNSPLPSAGYSISSPMLPSPGGAGQASPALSTATAPGVFSPPPQLKTSISSSPIGFSSEPSTWSASAAVESPATARAVGPTPMEARTESTSSTSTDGSYSSALEEPRLRPEVKRANIPAFDPLRVTFYDDAEEGEDWTTSVLLAADITTDFTSHRSVQEAIASQEARGR